MTFFLEKCIHLSDTSLSKVFYTIFTCNCEISVELTVGNNGQSVMIWDLTVSQRHRQLAQKRLLGYLH